MITKLVFLLKVKLLELNQLALEAFICLNLYPNYTANDLTLEYWQLKGKNEAGKIHYIKETQKIAMLPKNI